MNKIRLTLLMGLILIVTSLPSFAAVAELDFKVDEITNIGEDIKFEVNYISKSKDSIGDKIDELITCKITSPDGLQLLNVEQFWMNSENMKFEIGYPDFVSQGSYKISFIRADGVISKNIGLIKKKEVVVKPTTNTNSGSTSKKNKEKKIKNEVKAGKIGKNGKYISESTDKAKKLMKSFDRKSSKELRNDVKELTNSIGREILLSDVSEDSAVQLADQSLDLVSELMDKTDMSFEDSYDVINSLIVNNISRSISKTQKESKSIKMKMKSAKLVEKSLEDPIYLDTSKDKAINIDTLKEAIEKNNRYVKEMKDTLLRLNIPSKNLVAKVVLEPELKNEQMNLELNKDILDNIKSAGTKLQVKSSVVGINISSDMIKKDSLANDALEVSIKDVDAAISKEIEKGGVVGNKKISSVGIVKDLKVASNSKSLSDLMSELPEIEISVDGLDDSIDKSKLSVCIYDEEKDEYEFVKSNLIDNKLVFRAPHFSIYTVVKSESGFSDVKNHWAEDTIESMAARGYIKGKSKDSFMPDDNITKAEFATLIVTSLGLESEGSGNFLDVEEGKWYYDDIAIAARNGIYTVDENGNYDPERAIRRDEMAEMLVKAFNAKNGYKLYSDESTFVDCDEISVTCRKYVNGAMEAGLISGYEDKTFRPNNTATRAEATQMILNLVNY